MQHLIIEAIGRSGYVGIFLLMVIENVFPPIPSEVIMGLGGVLVARGDMAFWPLMAAGTLGTVAGNYAWYWIGDRWGYERTRPFIDRWGRWLTIDFEHMEAASRFFRSHGQWVVFALRFSPFMRTLISHPAGLAHKSVWRFLAFISGGAAVGNARFIYGVTFLARYLTYYVAGMGWVFGGLVGGALVAYLWRVMTWKPRQSD
jgi:membrane protein DedA with SNARE-associated domain